ncbi:MAG: phosphoribosyl-AMP cyclohydrolase [Dehalococcoidia bacterium]
MKSAAGYRGGAPIGGGWGTARVPQFKKETTPMELKYKDDGLLPAVIQDAATSQVLMVGYMNAEAVRRTRESGVVWFYSRSRQAMWQKGETSGNVLRVREIWTDCDADVLLVKAEPAGPTCHTGEASCFFDRIETQAGEPATPAV